MTILRVKASRKMLRESLILAHDALELIGWNISASTFKRLKQLIKECERVPEREDRMTHSDETMLTVGEALFAAGLTEKQVVDAVNQMQNRGIYFREVGPEV